MNNEPTLRPAPSLREIHATLRTLYEREYPKNSPPHLFEILLPKLPKHTRTLIERQLDALIQQEIGTTRKFADLTSGERSALAAFFDQEVLQEHKEIGRDSILSNDKNSITHFDTQSPVVAHYLITAVARNTPESLERMGCVFFDVDGTKTLVACISHTHAGKYLEGLAKFLCHPPAPVQQWLEERHLFTQAYSYAGDEFIVIVRSHTQTIDKKTLDAFAREVQTALAEEQELTTPLLTHPHVTDLFDDPRFIMEYDGWSDEDRAAYKKNPSIMKNRMNLSRSKLPTHFTHSVSCGSATFLEALDEALSPDTEDAKTLEELGVNAFRLMVARADSRMKEDKQIFREHMTDPKWKMFLLRNAENRRLMSVIEDLRSQLIATLERLGKSY